MGLNAQAQALAHGVRVSGCTVHFVDAGLDSGPIVEQRVVAVEDRDTVESLSARAEALRASAETREYGDAVREAGFPKPRSEGEENGEWIIVDCGQAVAHIMQPAIRQYYRLEEIWGDTPVRLKLGAAKPRKLTASEDEAPAKGAAKPAGKAAAKKSAAVKKAPARKTAEAAPKKAAAKKAPAKQAPKATAVAAKKPAAKAAAKKAPVKTVVVNKPVAKKAAPKAAASAKKPAAKKAPARKAAAKKSAPKA